MYQDDEDILERLTVSDGVPQYIDPSRTKSQHTGESKQQKNMGMEERPGYEEHYENREVYCIHQNTKITTTTIPSVNESIIVCDIGQDMDMCGSCPYRKSRVVRIKVDSVPNKTEKYE